MERLIFHTLKGIRGWSWLNISTIDVYKVIEIYHDKRAFCILNRDYPYKLTIKYNVQNIQYYITKRYQTEAEVLKEINDINLKRSKMNSLKHKFIKEHMDKIVEINSLQMDKINWNY